MKRTSKRTYGFAAVLAAALLVIVALLCGGGQFTQAAVSSYSDVIEDLRGDSTFTVDDYPAVADDYKLYVIQVAESVNDELFIYVYQPSGQGKDLRASTIRLSQTTGINVSPRDYKLTFLNAVGVFYKYKVEGLELRKDPVRYYELTAIHRPFDKIMDDGAGGGNVINEVVFEVGQVWTATTLNGNVTYNMEEVEVIKASNKYVGFTQYEDGTKVGWGITGGLTRAHFVAFSTDHKIDKLISADVGFKVQDVACKVCCSPAHLWHDQGKAYDYEFGEAYQHQPDPLTLHYKDHGTGGGYTWDRIRSTSEWLADEINKNYHLTDEGENILGTQWVLNFYETQIQAKVNGVWAPILVPIASLFTGDADVKYSRVSNVTILRLSFETDNKFYNLGVVDNKQTGSGKPATAPNDTGGKCTKATSWIIAAVVVVAAIIVLMVLCIVFPAVAPIVKQVLQVVGKVIAWIFKGLWWLICLPFKAIAKAIKNRKNKPKKSKNKSRSKK
ncbi:MAG: hypothetical protein K2K60_05035 [Clostridia bacterium]|nr:hypothetical protein [Clostridia bacterium]